jgi:hypothetical protein
MPDPHNDDCMIPSLPVTPAFHDNDDIPSSDDHCPLEVSVDSFLLVKLVLLLLLLAAVGIIEDVCIVVANEDKPEREFPEGNEDGPSTLDNWDEGL